MDQSGKVVPDVELAITNVDTNVSSTTKTNGDGIYVLTALQPGHYRVIVTKEGFKQIALSDVILNVQDTVSRNFNLYVGAASETVTVNANGVNVNTTDASVGTVVDRQFVENMPLNGRSLQSLISLSPGVMTPKPADTNPGGFSVNGQRADANYFTIDGTSANVGVGQGGDSSYNGPGSAGALLATSTTGGTNSMVSIDAMQEFKIQTSTFAPEYGRTPGAQVSIITRSGTNQFHGTAFEYLRNNALDASDWFTNYYGLPKPAERQNDFGGVFGGPIVKSRLFFFLSYEGQRLVQPQTKTEVEPSTAARLAAPASVQPLLNAFPIPNVSDGPETGVFAGSYSNPSTLNATSIRMDYAPTNKINVFGRYNHAPSEGDIRGSFGVYALSTFQHLVSQVDTLTTGATVTFRPNLLDEFRFNYSRVSGASGYESDNFGGAVVPPDSYLWQSYPQANSQNDNYYAIFAPDLTGWYSGGQAKGANSFHQRQLNFVDTIAWTRGRHNVKGGVDYRRLTPIVGNVPYQLGVYFSGVAGAVSGAPYLAAVATDITASLRPLFQNLSLFVQDTWQVTPRLTLTYGLRWEYNPPPSELTGHPLYTVVNLDDPANAALAPRGSPLWKATHDNFAPRLGIAYTLRRTPGRELVVRGGGGIFYDIGNNGSQQGVFSFPYSKVNFISNPSFPLSPADATPLPLTLDPPYGNMYAFEPNLKLPRTYQWNLSLQQSLGPNQSFTATYLGAAGRNLLRTEVIGPSLGLNPNFNYVTVATNDGYSNYDALQIQYQRRLSQGLQVLASYSFAHALDNASSQDFSSYAPYHSVYSPGLDYGNSDFDVRHSFSAAVTYNIPSPEKSRFLQAITGHWALDSLFRSNTARPVNVLTGLDPFNLAAVTPFTVARPDVVPNVPLYLHGSQYPGGKAINPAAFQDPASPTAQGNLGHNALWGFGAWEEDLAIRREFPIHEQLKLQFRAEFFNVFNHPAFGDPGILFGQTNVLNNPQFGLSTMTLAQSLYPGGGNGGLGALYQEGGPRSIQLALKLIF
jgi:hypothetical protein